MRNLLFRVNASSQIGTGHVMRCLAIAQAWQSSGHLRSSSFCTSQDIPQSLVNRIVHEGNYHISLPFSLDLETDAKQTLWQCQELNAEYLIVDGYHFNEDYQSIIKSGGAKFLLLDDYGQLSFCAANLVLNQNSYANEKLYPLIGDDTQLLLGCRYALLRQEFWRFQNVRADIRDLEFAKPIRLLVTLGGSDSNNMTSVVLNALGYLNPVEVEAKIIVGSANPNKQKLIAECEKLACNVKLYFDVNNISDLMVESDLAISAAGSTCWELAFLGLPALLIILAENQRLVAEHLEHIGVGINLGWYTEVTPENLAKAIEAVFVNINKLRDMSQKGISLVDGRGSHRVVKFIQDV
jgi:UDP-2,4-diacetamido-2,4,6-trideoxy-beta-L-altropyranose hydrolase